MRGGQSQRPFSDPSRLNATLEKKPQKGQMRHRNLEILNVLLGSQRSEDRVSSLPSGELQIKKVKGILLSQPFPQCNAAGDASSRKIRAKAWYSCSQSTGRAKVRM